ncbi:transglutaminase family protein [Rhizobiales bacterium TNE-4]|nr:transglutaminase family protein [Rhizobiales bacterium TNE-4]MBV1827210.1 transglutaminase family protein [Rhizobiales bacterium TNE-4]
MRYSVRQTTHYAYDEAVPFSRHIIRMEPGSRAGQDVLAHRLMIEPSPNERTEDRDFFGNRVTRIAIDSPHDRLSVTVEADILLQSAILPAPHQTAAWEMIASHALTEPAIGADAPGQYLFPSRMVPIDPAITAYATISFPPGRPVLEAACDLNQRIKADFIYDTTATAVDTDPAHAFAMRRGVCQDFAHIMIAGLRGLGLPAAYVSGWLRTVPPEGEMRLEGADATHAWVSVWCGRDGWIGLDPTNGILAAMDHIVLAMGRDYADVAPLDGIIWSGSGHSLHVAVDVVPIMELPTDA